MQDVIYKGEVDNEITFEDAIQDDSPAIEETIVEKVGNQQLIQALKCLTDEEQKILSLRYGIDDGIARSLEEIGKMHHLTRERIRQKEQKALVKVRRSKIVKNLL